MLFLSVLPFFGLLFSIAFLPLKTPQFWEKHYGRVSLFWACLAFGCVYLQGSEILSEALLTRLVLPLIDHFVPFIVLLSALYVITGGIVIHIRYPGKPLFNSLFLMIFSLVAGVFGTTGAAMLGVRPLLEMNYKRKYKTHTLVFFIFLVCNIGGALSSVGDPPLFLGFLKGVPFMWPTVHLFPHFLWVGGSLVCVYWAIDSYYWRREKNTFQYEDTFSSKRLDIKGTSQFILMGFLLTGLVVSGKVSLGVWTWGHFHMSIAEGLCTLFLFVLMAISFYLKPYRARVKDKWHVHPLKEIAILFLGIFITAEPLLSLLQQGCHGPTGPYLSFLNESSTQAFRYFWATGLLSSFLDNAPTYLIFFCFAGGKNTLLSLSHRDILLAISTGAVFMGALTYIGNAPNLLVKAIAEEEYRVPMPSFLGYMGWACVILLPVFGVWSWWVFSG